MRSPESPLAYLIKSNLVEWSQQGQREEEEEEEEGAGRRMTLLRALISLTAFSLQIYSFSVTANAQWCCCCCFTPIVLEFCVDVIEVWVLVKLTCSHAMLCESNLSFSKV